MAQTGARSGHRGKVTDCGAGRALLAAFDLPHDEIETARPERGGALAKARLVVFASSDRAHCPDTIAITMPHGSLQAIQLQRNRHPLALLARRSTHCLGR